jgi:hypothetical protein
VVFQKQYVRHLEKGWRIVHAAVNYEDGESILNISLAMGEDCIIHDKINVAKDIQRLKEFNAAVGNYGEYEGLLDRRVSVIFDDRFQRRIVGYAPSFSPLAHG